MKGWYTWSRVSRYRSLLEKELWLSVPAFSILMTVTAVTRIENHMRELTSFPDPIVWRIEEQIVTAIPFMKENTICSSILQTTGSGKESSGIFSTMVFPGKGVNFMIELLLRLYQGVPSHLGILTFLGLGTLGHIVVTAYLCNTRPRVSGLICIPLTMGWYPREFKIRTPDKIGEPAFSSLRNDHSVMDLESNRHYHPCLWRSSYLIFGWVWRCHIISNFW